MHVLAMVSMVAERLVHGGVAPSCCTSLYMQVYAASSPNPLDRKRRQLWTRCCEKATLSCHHVMDRGMGRNEPSVFNPSVV